MDKEIQKLNQRLAEGLGYAKGNEPRFKWCYAPDMTYFYRRDWTASWVQRCWADRKGRAWMLCQWRHPHVMTPQGEVPISEAAWWEMFHGSYPYPGKGMYYPFAETALPIGMRPTSEITQWYIRSLDAQMSNSYADHLREVNDEVARDKEREETQWVECVQNSNPAFSKYEITPNSGHTAFQVPGLKPARAEESVTA